MKNQTKQMREVKKNFIKAIEASNQLIQLVEKSSFRQNHHIQSRCMYRAIGRAQMLHIEALQKAYQAYLKEHRCLFFTEVKYLKETRELIRRYLSDAVELEELLKVGIKIVEIDKETDFTKADWIWLCKINQLWSIRELVTNYQIEQPKAMTTPVFERYVEELIIHEKMLRIEEGWDKQAILGYFQQINTYLKNTETTKRILEQLSILKVETKRVGSRLYTKLFNESNYTDREKIILVMKHLQASIDSNGMLQLKGPYQLDSEMPPHRSFLESFAKSVTKAYPSGLLPGNNPETSKQTLKIIHQFRMYLDLQNIRYIRTHYAGATDLDKLLAYGQEQPLIFSKSSRLHNRYSAKYPFKGQENDKITTKNGLSEFIVNVRTGKFVTQWDVLHEKNGEIGIFSEDYHPNTLEGKKIVEGESFNYSNHPKQHQIFDVVPARASSGLEHHLKIAAKKYWKSEEWITQGGNYSEKYKKKKEYPIVKEKKKAMFQCSLFARSGDKDCS